MERLHDEPGMPREGWEVLTSDGESLGHVAAIHGGYFSLDTRAAGYWLSRRHIRHCEEGIVRLAFTKNEADEHRLRKPGLEPASDPDRAGIRDRVLDDTEALTNRERMERELIQQRGTIDTGLALTQPAAASLTREG